MKRLCRRYAFPLLHFYGVSAKLKNLSCVMTLLARVKKLDKTVGQRGIHFEVYTLCWSCMKCGRQSFCFQKGACAFTYCSFPFEIGINSQPHLLSNEQQQERRKERDLIAQAKRADLKMAYQTSASRASSTQSNTEGLAVYEDNVQNFINVNEDPCTIYKPDNEVGCINSQTCNIIQVLLVLYSGSFYMAKFCSFFFLAQGVEE